MQSLRSSFRKFIAFYAVYLLAVCQGCTHTTTSTTHEVVEIHRVPEVSPGVQLDTLNREAAAVFLRTHESIGRCVFRGAVAELYWKDDQKVDRVVLVQDSPASTQLYKVEVVGEKVIEVIHGNRNGVPFSSTRVRN